MKLKSSSYWIIALCFFAVQSFAQTSCEYTMRLFDTFADSWNGAVLTLNVNEEFSTLTMSVEDGMELDVPLVFTTGDSITLSFASGAFDNEVSYQLLDPNGEVVFEDGPSPMTGDVFATRISCPDCSPVAFSAFVIDDIRDFTASFSWLQSNEDNTYWLQYGEPGFDPVLDSNFFALNVNTNSFQLMGLEENTAYDVYVSALCGMDTSTVAGPLSFSTVFTNDVGIVDITRPNTGCEIGESDTLEVTLQNFGAKPQTLIPFNFIVNGMPANVNQPLDGVFTGVLGKDSMFITEFDQRLDIVEPNIYEIIAYTELEEDSDMENDTFRTEIINIPNIMEYPYFTDFEDWTGGWRPAADSRNSSWEFGTPSLGVSSAASGANAWVTSLDTTYNNSEISYLISPCLDFTALDEDPALSFSLFIETEACCDEAWVEVSVDGGDNWSKVLENERSLNWYNDTSNEWWDGDNGFSTWATVMNLLEGTAGEAEVLVRIVFSSGFSGTAAGVAVDNIFISTPLQVDMASVRVDQTGLEECGQEGDQVQLEIANLGLGEQRAFEVYYQINGGAFVIEQINEPLLPLQTLTYTFEQPFNSAEFDTYTITAGVIAADDEFEINNITEVEITNIFPIPFLEDFETARLSEGWSTPGETNAVTIGHNAPSFVVSDNLFATDNLFELNSPTFGYVQEGDSLSFDYRFVDFGLPGEVARQLLLGDSLTVSISIDCGATYETIFKVDLENHEPSEEMKTIRLSLENYIDERVKLRFNTYRGITGDFYIDIDNINIKRCPPSLELSARVENLIRPDSPDGSIIIDAAAGFAPYTYEWSNGSTDKAIFGLEAGTYNVTVSDAVGCKDEISVNIIVTSVSEVALLERMQLAPNPTNARANLQLELREVADVRVLIFNAVGQLVRAYPMQEVQELNQNIDLGDYANGLYFVQVWANGQAHTERLVLVD